MPRYSCISDNPLDTVRFGERLARACRGGEIICLFGELGSGKTTLVKGLAKGMGIRPAKVLSPTFVLMNIYEGRLPLYHFDLYRLEDVKGIESIGYEEFFYGEGVSVIEWAERLGEVMPEEFLKIKLSHKDELRRTITVTAQGRRYEALRDRALAGAR